MKYDFDFAIIGAGASGLIAADFALKLGARVVMIEKDRIGGDCTWSGCVPSKSLIKAASVAHAVRQAARFGVGAEPTPTDMPQVRAWLNSTIDHIYAPTTPEALLAKGIVVLLGPASFADAHTIQVGEQRITAGKVLINTGAQPRIPAIAGLDGVPYLTYKQIFQNDRLPQRLIVVGGGPVGCEIAQSYRRLGAEVSLIAEALLPSEEPEAATVLASVFAAEASSGCMDAQRRSPILAMCSPLPPLQGKYTATCCSSRQAGRRWCRGLGLNAREFAIRQKELQSTRISARPRATSTHRAMCWAARSIRIWRAGRAFRRRATPCYPERAWVLHALCHVSHLRLLKWPGLG